MKCIQLDQNFRLYLGNLPDNVDKDHLHNYNKQNILELYLILHIQLYKNNCYRVKNIVLCNLEAFKKQKQHYDALVYILSEYENFKSLNVDRDTKNVCKCLFCEFETDLETQIIILNDLLQIEKISRLIIIVVQEKMKIIMKELEGFLFQFENVQFAKIAIILLQNKIYDGREIDIAFYDPDKQY